MYRPTMNAPALRVAEDIVPIAEFKAHVSEVVRGLATRGRPCIVTQNGKPAAVLLSPAEFDRLSYHARLVAAASQGLSDVEQGRVVSHEELGKALDARFGELPRARRAPRAKPARR